MPADKGRMIPTLKLTGVKRAKAALKELEKLPSVIKGATLHGKGRSESDLSSGDVAEFLQKQGRDFFHTQDVAEAAAERFADTVEERLQMLVSGKTKAGTIAARAWRDAMVAAMKKAAENIADGKWVGDGSSTLSEEHEKHKQGKYGFAYPIGKATGQLLENLHPSNKGNIKLQR